MVEKVAEYTKAAIGDKPAFHINFVTNVTKHCDCKPSNDVSIIPDIGMFASFDPIALDQACVDAINSSPLVEDSELGEAAIAAGEEAQNGLIPAGDGHDVFGMVHPDTHWEAGLIHGEKLGLGTRNYELKKK